jgi:uncharacterized protein YndB with AHSA1/START domain
VSASQVPKNTVIKRKKQIMSNAPLIIERTYNAPADMLWNALTDSTQMQQWYFPITVFKAQVGFEFHFEGGSEQTSYVHLCKVTDVIPGKKITYSWHYDGYPGMSYVTWELFEEGKQTRVQLTHEGLETFPQDNPDFAKKSFTEGWTYFVEKALKHFVERS